MFKLSVLFNIDGSFQMLHERLSQALKEAMRNKDQCRVSTIRLILAAIKDREIAKRGDGGDSGLDEEEILQLLSKMVRQRQDSKLQYEQAGRIDLAEREQQEIDVISEFLPRQMDDAEIEAAVSAVIGELGATGLKDMGRVMGTLKARHPGEMDFAKAGKLVKAALS